MKWYSYLPFLDEHTYERYLPTAFDESMTLLQKVNKVIEGLNTVIQAVNTTFDEVDKQNDKIVAIRDDFETLKEWLENEGLQERVVWVLNEWFDSGKLATIIAEEVFDMKVDKSTFEQYILDQQAIIQQLTDDTQQGLSDVRDDLTTAMEQTEQSLSDIQTNLTETTDITEQHTQTLSHYVNVTDFGAVGDGVTDDTQAIQNAINAIADTGLRNVTLLFAPTNGNHYLTGTLTIPEIPVITFMGIGDSKIVFTSRIGFSIQCEALDFKNLNISSNHALAREKGSVLFSDDRPYRALDFDLTIKDCTLSNINNVVTTRGRGVWITGCSFSGIPGTIIKIIVRAKGDVVEGPEDVQTYEEGYRGYHISHSRFHYLTHACLIETEGDSSHVVKSVAILNNWIEGGCAYFSGSVTNLLCKGNHHYHDGYPYLALFNIINGKNIVIDINVNVLGDPPLRNLLNITGDVDTIRVTGTFMGLKHHLIRTSGNLKNAYFDVVVSDVHMNPGGWSPYYLELSGDPTTVDGLYLGGMFQGVDVNRSLYWKQTNVTVKNFKDNLVATGLYDGPPIWVE